MKTITQMLHHSFWANERILLSLQQIDNPKVRNIFSHILYAEQVWATRLQGQDSSHLPIWQETDLDTCARLVKNNRETFIRYLNHLSEDDLDKSISYQNSTGKEFTNSRREILTHLSLHGQHHRGQINTLLREAGTEPPAIDFIIFAR
ncbi:DinB family protein [Mesobacillus foraminis]|uniref:Putative damage-inducible protein DinB n=1 Tax=Mesobacillus foraminis TaxID=279826 RepID=A0A4R2BKI2_9BACI|nr:DinB family protein [Mesobacillus foraminis]TCN26639.1 putative damage-inducible protein DinB [Mesobacillus foraminis]